MNHSLRYLEGIAWLRTIRMGELGYPSGLDLNTLDDDDNIISKFFQIEQGGPRHCRGRGDQCRQKVVTIVKKATSKSSRKRHK